jgi:hypothetical protein
MRQNACKVLGVKEALLHTSKLLHRAFPRRDAYLGCAGCEFFLCLSDNPVVLLDRISHEPKWC